jgi:hypothetical protein
MSHYPKVSRFVTLLIGLIATGLAIGVVEQAAATTPVPNSLVVGFSVAAGGNSGGITPPPSVPVSVTAVDTTSGFRGVGHLSLLRIAGNFLEWVGLDSPNTALGTSGGINGYGPGSGGSPVGTTMCRIDFSHSVVLQLASGDAFVVHNGGSGTHTGVVTLIW